MGISNERFAEIVAGMGPFPTGVPDAPRNPYSNARGQIIDQPKFTAFAMAQVKDEIARRESLVKRCLDCPGLSSAKCCKRGAL